MSGQKGNGESEDSSDRIRTLSLANLDLTVLISKLQNEIKDLRLENAKQKRKLEDVGDGIILKEKLKRAAEVFYEQDAEIRSLKSQLDKATRKNSELEKKNNELKEKLDSTLPNQRLIEKLEERLAKTSSHLEKAAKMVVQKDLDIRELRSRTGNDKHAQREVDLKKEIVSLESQLKKAINFQSLQNDRIKSQIELVEKAEARCSKEITLVCELRRRLKETEEKLIDKQKNFNDLDKRFEQLKAVHRNDVLWLEDALQAKEEEIAEVKKKNGKLFLFAKNIREKSKFSRSRNPCSILGELGELEAHVSKELGRKWNTCKAYPKKERQLPRWEVPSSSQKSVSRPLPMLSSPPLSTPEKRAGDRRCSNDLGSDCSHKKKFIPSDHYAKKDDKPENSVWQSTSASAANQEIRQKVIFGDTDEEIDVEDD